MTITATEWTGLDALDALDRCDGNVADAARLLGCTTTKLRTLEREGRAMRIAELREDAEADAPDATEPTPDPTPTPPQPPQAPDEDAPMTAQPIEIESDEQGAWTEWMARGQLMTALGLSSATVQVAIKRGATSDGRRIQTQALSASDRAALDVPRNARTLYRVELAAAAPIRAPLAIAATPADDLADQAVQLRRDRDEVLAALDAQREEATQAIARMELEHERERAALLEDARRAEAERDEARAKLATTRELLRLARVDNAAQLASLGEQESAEAAMTREAITALERERDAAAYRASVAEIERDRLRERVAEWQASCAARTKERDEALARAASSSTSHLPIELMRVMRAATEALGGDDILGVDLRVRADRAGEDEPIKIKRGVL